MSKTFNSIVKALRKSQAAAKKRGLKLFSRMSVAHVDDDDNDMFFAEKFFCNGDFYTGQWAVNVGHGDGRYLWQDGCAFVGEWHKGKIMGKGKFSWPSGATYEGEFKSGYMDGKGTYIGPYGDSYRGSWVMNMRHGHGMESYSNGDYYDGEWRRGMQNGNGRYQWKNGESYIGEWKNGIMNGTGKMILKNGNRFEGTWDSGYPKGNGVFRLGDGSLYVGFWSDDSECTVSYHPAGESSDSNSDWDPQQLYIEELSDCKVCQWEEIPIFPSHKMMDWAGVGGEFLRKMPINSKISKGNGRRGSIDCGLGLDQDGCDRKSIDWNEGFRRKQIKLPPAKKQGVTISKGHKNYELMLNLQLGIRHSVGRPAPTTSLELKASAFDPKSKLWTKFPSEGSKHTPPHQSCEFKWKDYCPVVFRALRKLFKVDPADYMLSICGDDALRELSSPGKSGSFFYLTNDDRYMIKTLKKTEVKVLLKMLPAYYNHVRAFEKTLVTKFFGLHCVKNWPGQKKVRFVIMGNLFCSDYDIHRRFDLKGSTFGRTTDKPEEELDATTTLKDLDLNYTFRLQKVWFHEFCRQVDRDLDFLEQERIMDYSLLVGIHFRETSALESVTPAQTSGFCNPTGNGDFDYEAPRLSRIDMDPLLLDPSRWASIQLGINMPGRVERTVRRNLEIQLIGEPTGELYEVVLFFGIIDILQDYDISKKLEHAYKSIQYDPTSISAVDPKQYSKRFRDFVFRVFGEDT